ncbi:MAG: glycosyltransferase family 1 protein [Chloroflexi bacterium]|nr:MAG: glycosyltransferase family 1 protein [Chloroflexota bacterium]
MAAQPSRDLSSGTFRHAMRVLFFGPYPLPGQPISGGVMAVVQALARGLAERTGFQVGVASVHPGLSPAVEQEDALTIYRIPVPRLRRLRLQLPLRQALVAAAHDFAPDIIHAHGTGYAAAAALDSRYPSVITVHGVIRNEAVLSGARGFKERLAWQYDALFEWLVLRRARDCVAISPYIRRVFARHHHIRWTDIENPVDEACFALVRQPEPGLLLCPARVIPRKGIDVLIRAFADVASVHPQAHLFVAGETETNPDYVAHCRDLAARLGVNARISLAGGLPRSRFLEALSRATCVVLPARQETAPVAVAEALAAGCPVVASAVGGVPDMIESERNGLLVPPDAPPALAAALNRILSLPPATAASMSAAARASARRYRLDVILRKTVSLYENLLAA